MWLCHHRSSFPRPRRWSSSPRPMSTSYPMSRLTSSSAGAGGGVRGKGVGIDLASITGDGPSIVPLLRASTETCHPVGGTTTGSIAGRDVNGTMSASRTARCNATGVVGKGTDTGNSTTQRAFSAWDRGRSGPGEVHEWSGDRTDPGRCEGRRRCAAGSRLTEAAVPSNQVRRDLAPVDRAARTVGPDPTGATTTGADTVADSELLIPLCYDRPASCPTSWLSQPGKISPRSERPRPGKPAWRTVAPALVAHACIQAWATMPRGLTPRTARPQEAR
jgi:hypothetical protein